MKTMKNSNKYFQSGFTLLEILLVVAAIGLLAGIVIFAINPAKQLGDTRNAQRKVDVNTILNAVYQYSIDNGKLPDTIINDEVEICKTGAVCDGLIDLSVLTTNERYLASLPFDPNDSSETGTGYTIKMTNTSRVTVSAPSAEQDIIISFTR